MLMARCLRFNTKSKSLAFFAYILQNPSEIAIFPDIIELFFRWVVPYLIYNTFCPQIIITKKGRITRNSSTILMEFYSQLSYPCTTSYMLK